jgi:tRNA dimethylallyltransferase
VSGGGKACRVLRVLTGCTAVGKTAWALRWAEANSAEIISCDSLLFYRGMDIGTAKPSAEELARVRHHLVDIREISEPMNVAAYCALARVAAEEIASRGKAVLVVGGSGFYLRSFFAPVSDGLEIPALVRGRVAALMESGGLPALVGELGRLNPDGLGGLDAANPRRVANALERCIASGRTLAELARAFSGAPFPFAGWDVRLERLDLPAQELDLRIEARVSSMIGAGLVAEVESLLRAGLKSNASASRAIGYRETIDVLEGRADPAGLSEAIARDTRALVKKQRTWFRTQLPAHPVRDAAGGGPGPGLFLG